MEFPTTRWRSHARRRDSGDPQSGIPVDRRRDGGMVDGAARRLERRTRRAGASALPFVWQAPHDARLPLQRVSGVPSSVPLKRPVNPALLEHARERGQSLENRVADRITAFSGSMRFVYLHIIWFASWIGFHAERYPFGLLTMIVSLEAIFLSTFVMISQNRADAKREVIANQQWQTVQEEDTQNQELLQLSRQILQLTEAVHAYAAAAEAARSAQQVGGHADASASHETDD
jgi:uncharacterized membrane protein